MEQEARYQLGRRVSWYTILGNILLTAVKAVAGVISKSSALMADAVHSASDIISTLVVLYSLRIAKAPPDAEHPYGHGRAESIAAKVLSIILIGVGVGMVGSAIDKLRTGQYAIPGNLALWAILLSIVGKEAMFRYTLVVGNKIRSNALVADAWHHRSDAFSSIAAFFGVMGARLGFPVLDPLAGGFVAIFIIKMGIGLFRSTVDELMDAQVDEELRDKILWYSEKVSGVEHVDDIRLRRYGSHYHVDLKLSVDRGLTVREGHDIASVVRQILIQSLAPVSDVLVHVDPYPDQKDLAEPASNAASSVEVLSRD